MAGSARASTRCASETATAVERAHILVTAPPILPALAVVVAHDSTLIPTLCALGAFDQHAQWPPYASQLAFEVYRGADGRSFLRILWNGEPLELSNLGPSHPRRCSYMYDVREVVALLRPHGRTAQWDPSRRAQACAAPT